MSEIEFTAELVTTDSTVTYERLYNLGNYENERIGYSLPVIAVEGEDPTAAASRTLQEARSWVEQQHLDLEAERDRQRGLQREIYNLEGRKEQLTYQVQLLEEQLDRLKTEQAGSAPQASDDPPF